MSTSTSTPSYHGTPDWANARRFARIIVSPELVGGLLVAGERTLKVECGLPPGARYAGGSFDPDRAVYVLVFEHESFSPIPPGWIFPEIRPLVSIEERR